MYINKLYIQFTIDKNSLKVYDVDTAIRFHDFINLLSLHFKIVRKAF